MHHSTEAMVWAYAWGKPAEKHEHEHSGGVVLILENPYPKPEAPK